MLLRCLLLSLVFLGGCRLQLPAGDYTTPDFWADFFLDLYAEDRAVGELEAGPGVLDEPRTVLLITGVTIRAEWFDLIAARLERDGFRPVVYEPPALLSGDLFEASEDLAAVVERVRAESGQDKIDILAECTGGLIARHYIQSLGGEESVSRMVTFVSPQNGIDKAPWAAAIAGWPALHDLSPGSDFLRAVNDAPLPAGVPFTSIYTCDDEYIQPYTTSIIPGATNIELCDDFLGHFETFFDPEVYLVMHAALTAPTGAEDEVEPVEPEVVEPEVAVPDEDLAEAPVEMPGEVEVQDPDQDEVEDQGDPISGEFAGNDDADEAAEQDEAPDQIIIIREEAAGCSASGPGGSPTPLLLFALGLGLVRRRGRA